MDVDESLISTVEETNGVTLVLNVVIDGFTLDSVKIDDESVIELSEAVLNEELEVLSTLELGRSLV